jgi:hypothetical protein
VGPELGGVFERCRVHVGGDVSRPHGYGGMCKYMYRTLVCQWDMCVTVNLQARNHGYVMYIHHALASRAYAGPADLDVSVERTCRVGGEDRRDETATDAITLHFGLPSPPHSPPQLWRLRNGNEIVTSVKDHFLGKGWRHRKDGGSCTS